MTIRRCARDIAVVLVTAIGLLRAQAQPPAPDAQGLKIVVLEGEDGVNIVKKKSAVRPVVEVRDKNDLPLAGVSVIFLLPNSGASATINGSHSLTVLTDSAGRATVSGMKPVGSGAFKIQVSASFHGQTTSTSISQTNYLTVAAATAAGAATGATAGASGGLSGGVIAAIAVGAAAAIAVGVVVATHGGGSSTPAATAPVGTISLGAGAIVFGPPH